MRENLTRLAWQQFEAPEEHLKKQHDSLQKTIDEIASQFKDYPLLEILRNLENKYISHQKNVQRLQNLRPAEIKKRFKRALQLSKKLNNLILNDELALYSFFNFEHDFIFNLINNDISHFITLLEIEIKLIKDNGGRPQDSMQNFLLFHLLIAYAHGTKKPIKCYWSVAKEAGIGKTFIFLTKIRTLLPKFSETLRLSNDDRYLCKVVQQITKKFPDFSKAPSIFDSAKVQKVPFEKLELSTIDY